MQIVLDLWFIIDQNIQDKTIIYGFQKKADFTHLTLIQIEYK